MITFTIAQRLGQGDLSIPLANTYNYRVTASTGGSLLNDTRRNAQTVVGEELYRPLVYAYWTYRDTMNYRLTGNRLVEDADVVREVRLVNILVPLDNQLPILTFGSATKAKDALQATREAIQSAGGDLDYQILEYDLRAISDELRSDQWMRGFARDGNVNKGKIYGSSIELDQIFNMISIDSEPNEVGVTLQVPNAALMVRILHGGRVQFYNFSSNHIWERNHDEFGDPLPLIYETLGFLRRYTSPSL